MPIKQCHSYPGYGADHHGNVYSYFKNIGGKWQISASPQKKLSPFLECPNAKEKRAQRRLCQFIRFDGKRVKMMVHRLVADAWHGPCPKELVCSHYNDCATDNRPKNLSYVSKRVNAKLREKNCKNDITIEKLQKQLNRYIQLYGELK